MIGELRDKAIKNLEEHKKKRRGVYTVGFIFSCIGTVLYIVSTTIPSPVASFWIKFPIIVLAMVYGIVYFGTFGFPFLGDSDELSTEEIEREMVKIYKKENALRTSVSIEAELELKELEELEIRQSKESDFV